MTNTNPLVDEFLTFYSQSERSTGGTRGYDARTYVETKLDRDLAPKILNAEMKLVVLTGNAGDGKTAFIQRLEADARVAGVIFGKQTDNGCQFTLNGVKFETLYDGSQDFQGTDNDAVLAAFFHDFEGNQSPAGTFTKIIAINEGKLRDFILNKPQYSWLGKQVHHALSYHDFQANGTIVFVNLNLRSVVDGGDGQESIFDSLLDRLLDRDELGGFWKPCEPENCAYASRCYIKHNIDSLRDPLSGPQVRRRLKQMILALHLRKQRHITLRDLRSILAFILFNKWTCEQLQSHLDANRPIIDRYYYNAVFDHRENDRVAQLLAELDIAAVSNPKLDNYIHFHEPTSSDVQNLFAQGDWDHRGDLPHLQRLHDNRPTGTQDQDPEHLANATRYHATMRRKLFFESDDAKMDHAGLPTWQQMMPYSEFERFLAAIRSSKDDRNALRNELTLAISKSERIYNPTVGQEYLCLRSSSVKRNGTKAFYGFPASDFEVIVKAAGARGVYVEYLPNCIFYHHVDRSAELEVPLDLFEILCRIRDGYVPTSGEMRTFFLNLEMFKRRVTAKRADRVFLTEDDTTLYEIRGDAAKHLVMTKVGG